MIFQLSAALAFAVAQAAPQPPVIPPSTLDDTLEVSGDSLAARQIKTRMFIQVRVNGQGPYRFLVDSGADRSVIGLDLSQRLKLPPRSRVMVQNMAGVVRVDTVLIDSLTIGSSEIPAISAPALPERFIGADGLLGIDALAEQRLMFDFDAKTVTVQDSRLPVAAASDEIVVTARRRNGQLILTQATVGRTHIHAVIDSGAETTVGNFALRAAVFRSRKPPAVQSITLISVTGQSIVADLVYIPEITIGRITLQNVPVAFVDAPPFALFGLGAQPALMVGTDLLESFRRVSLDFRNRRVRFVLRR